MKKILLLVIVAIGISGCAKDGEDGKAYLSFSWDWYVDSYSDNNPNVPYTITEESKYNVTPGTYHYEYYCSDGVGNYWGWDGTYTISINKGEKGKFLTDGANGADRNYLFFLYGNGSSMTVNKSGKPKKDLLNNPEEMMNIKKEFIGDTITETVQGLNGTLMIQRRMFRIKL